MSNSQNKMRRKRSDDLGQMIWDLHSFNIDPYSREIYLHPYIDNVDEESVGEVEFRMATKFIKNLNFLNQIGDSPILIHQHTCGGDWDEGITIYDSILHSKSLTTIIGYAHVRSMSSITFQAADRRILMPNTEVVIHLGMVGVDDRSRAAYENIESAKRSDMRMLEIYTSRCIYGKFFKGKEYNSKQVFKYIKKQITEHHDDWILTAKEAVSYGFADAIFGHRGYQSMDKIRTVKKSRKKIPLIN